MLPSTKYVAAVPKQVNNSNPATAEPYEQTVPVQVTDTFVCDGVGGCGRLGLLLLLLLPFFCGDATVSLGLLRRGPNERDVHRASRCLSSYAPQALLARACACKWVDLKRLIRWSPVTVTEIDTGSATTRHRFAVDGRSESFSKPTIFANESAVK